MSAPDTAVALMPAVPAQALARQELCRFLAGCYYEPGPEFAEERLFASIAAAAQCLSPELARQAQQLARAFAAAPLQDLLVDYTQLFVGAPRAHAKPYASAWLANDTEQLHDGTLALLKLYAQGGFEMDPEFRDLPDHVAVELEFLYLLTYQQNQALASGDLAALQSVALVRSAFLDGHLGCWLGPFIQAVHDHAQCTFYRELAELTKMFVRHEGLQPSAVTRH